MVIMAVKEFGAKKGVGVDIDAERIKESKEAAKKAGVDDKVEFRQEDVFKVKDIGTASVVLLYMGEDLNKQLRPILEKELKPGSRIVSHRFKMGDWKPEETRKIHTKDDWDREDDYEVHLWTVGKKETKK
jgi:predicted O-methyltransferase YrrM